MAKYTYELRELLDGGFKLKLDSYPIYNEEYRETLNQKIIDHYYFREIGQETPDRFNFMLSRRMNEIMPYYNWKYKAQEKAAEIDPLITDKITTTYSEERDKGTDETVGDKGTQSGTVTEDTTTTGTGENSSKDVYSDTTTHNVDHIFSDVPSAPLPTNLQNGYYTTRDITTDSGSENSTNTTTGSTKQTDTVDSDRTTKSETQNDRTRKETINDDVSGTKTVTGYQNISAAELLDKYRALYDNVDREIIDDLEILFMGVY